jgi:transcriptional regulator with XRE-family HTH domain
MFMIKSEDQRLKTIKRIKAIEEQIQKVQESHGADKANMFAKSVARHLFELKEQVRVFQGLTEKGVEPLRPRDFSEVGSYLVKARIASGLTQSDLAVKLGVSQPMVHKYEASEYQGANVTVLSKVAKALGVTLHLETFAQAGSRTFDSKRQEALALYFIQQINNKYLGKTKLMKLLYYTDYEWIQKKGSAITGDAYIAMHYGPIPKHAEETLKRLQKNGVLKIESVKFVDYSQERYLALQDPDLSLFTREEIEHMTGIAKRFEFWTAKQMSDSTHEDWPWLSTELGEEIALYRVV